MLEQRGEAKTYAEAVGDDRFGGFRIEPKFEGADEVVIRATCASGPDLPLRDSVLAVEPQA
jgi:hypothetical protein